MAERFLLTVPGGAIIERGNPGKIVLAILAQPEGRTVFVREASNLGQVLELTTPGTNPIFTEHGTQRPLLRWASNLLSTLTSHYQGPRS